jgi:hypothetical protein
MNWLQDKSDRVTTDTVSFLLNADGMQVLPIGYFYALAAALVISLVIRWRARARTSTETAHTDGLPDPNLLLVALLGYIVLKGSMLMTL